MLSVGQQPRLRALAIAIAALVSISSIATNSHAADRINLSGMSNKGRYDRFIVKYRTAFQSDVMGRNLKGFKIKHLRRTALGSDVILSDRKLDRVEAEALMRLIAADTRVQYVEIDSLAFPALVPNDSHYSTQWGYFGSTAGVRAPSAWDMSTGSGVVVAVIDTGITSHSDLDANILPGYDFISDPARARDGDGRDSNPRDEGDWRVSGECYEGGFDWESSWHGTHVAGTVAATTNNAKGVAGVAFGAKLVPVRVLGRCGGYTSDIADAIVWASGGSVWGVPTNAHPAEVINLSLGNPGWCGFTYQNAINSAVGRGTTVVVAAGNNGADVADHAPGNCDNVIAVGAVAADGKLAWFSNYGSRVDVSAPGAEIMSTSNAGMTIPASESYAYKFGTSMAAPHVSGTVALMQSHRVALGFTPYSPREVESILKSTAYPLTAVCTGGCGDGIVDAAAAVRGTEGVKIFEQTDASGRIQIAVFERISPVARQHNTAFAVSVPSDYVVVGGGVQGTNLPEGNLLTASYPSADLTTWLGATKDHLEPAPARVKVWAIGMKIAGLTRQQVRDNVVVTTASSGFVGQADVKSSIPSDTVLIGGGFKVDWGGVGNLATASAPDGIASWRARSMAHIEPSTAVTHSYAISLRRVISGVGIISSTVNSTTSEAAAHPSTISLLTSGYALTGCGGFVNWKGIGNLLWSIAPLKSGIQSGCGASSKDHLESSPATITGYAVGIRAN